MKKNQLIIIFSLLIASVFLGGCGTLIAPSSWPGVAVDGDTVYLANGSHVYALQLSNGSERWRFPNEADNNQTFYAAPVFDGEGNIYFGSYSQNSSNGNDIYKLNQQNGNEIWHFDSATNRYIASQLVIDGAVYAPNADSTIYKLTSDGTWLEDWSFHAEEPLWAQPQWEDGTLYVSSMDHHIYAVDAESGEVVWMTDDLGSAITSPPLIGEADLYVGTFGSEIVAIEKSSGVVNWRAPMADWVWATPAWMDGNLYVGDQSGSFVVLDATNGEELWMLQADGAIVSEALVYEGNIYFGTESGKIYRVTVSESGEWDYAIIHTVQGEAYSPLVGAGDVILIGVISEDTILVVIDLDGNEKWDFSLEN